MRKAFFAAAVSLSVLTAAPAFACGGLVNPNGTISLTKTATLAAYVDGVEHYITSFEFVGGGAEFGSIVPLPGVPSKVERAGDWTLQRLVQEVAPPAAERAVLQFDAAAAPAKVLYETRIDALDITILEGGGRAVGEWALDHGFALSPDAPEVLEFYGRRSPIFMAARFDATEAAERGQAVGDGTPIHLTIPTTNPWVPLRILGLGLGPTAPVQADVFLLTQTVPAMLPEPTGPSGEGNGLVLERSKKASELLLSDLRSDKNMGWLPADGMWLSYLRVDARARDLTYDLALDVSGMDSPSPIAAGLAVPPASADDQTNGTPGWVMALPIAALVYVINRRLRVHA